MVMDENELRELREQLESLPAEAIQLLKDLGYVRLLPAELPLCPSCGNDVVQEFLGAPLQDTVIRCSRPPHICRMRVEAGTPREAARLYRAMAEALKQAGTQEHRG